MDDRPGETTTAAVTKSGRELSDEDIERLADQAEEGFDLSTWKPRPAKPAETADEDETGS